jgi:glutamyl/glutaminyl-tRNA synthetase
MQRLRTRIAPTPSGYLHIGNVVNFLLTWAFARSVGGHVTLRIDDMDPQMSRPEFVDDVFRTMDWLRIDIDDGPASVAEVEHTWSQRHRLPSYMSVLDSLAQHGLVFGCTCSRSTVAAADPSRRYPGTCRLLNNDLFADKTAWRFDDCSVADQPFPIMRLKNGLPAYHVVSVADDVAMGITWILRGADLEPSTRVQRALAARVEALAPFQKIKVVHHALVSDADGRKLSKSAGSTDIRLLRTRSNGINDVLRAVAMIHGCPVVDRVVDLPSVVRY